MEENTQAVPEEQNTGSDTSPVSEETVETSPDSRPEEVTTESGNNEQSESSNEKPENINNSQEQPEKRTRGERRISQLLGKLKDQNKPHSQEEYSDLFGGADEPLIKPEEYQTGVDPQEIQRRHQQSLYKIKDQVIREVGTQMKFQQETSNHYTDVEASLKDPIMSNPKVEKLVSDQYEALNTVINPTTGQRVFVPQVKMSDIIKRVKEIVDGASVEASANLRTKLSEQHDESAASPTGQGKTREVTTEDLRNNVSKDPDAVFKALEGRIGYSDN